MNFQVRFTKAAREDLTRLYSFLAKQDIQVAENALQAINKAIELLQIFPFTCRKAKPDTPFLRELIISFDTKGYVALFEIEDTKIVTILAVRHQREDDYH